mmetsp:Transcript_94519/g.266899  ORF Transcript_94519/g.266899 Transcript_94519/m.266899 type:complete len:253 (+) Transcript_94519:448-1206(+)
MYEAVAMEAIQCIDCCTHKGFDVLFGRIRLKALRDVFIPAMEQLDVKTILRGWNHFFRPVHATVITLAVAYVGTASEAGDGALLGQVCETFKSCIAAVFIVEDLEDVSRIAFARKNICIPPLSKKLRIVFKGIRWHCSYGFSSPPPPGSLRSWRYALALPAKRRRLCVGFCRSRISAACWAGRTSGLSASAHQCRCACAARRISGLGWFASPITDSARYAGRPCVFLPAAPVYCPSDRGSNAFSIGHQAGHR